jgi:hypothetical protein
MKAITHPPREASDWLSPIIIKELRQGMRGRVFLGSFLLIQVAMMFCASGALVAASVTANNQFNFFSGLFWFITSIPLLVILPWMGLGVLGNEIKGNSLELVYLTRLTPWRIVTGKWAALFAQSLLFVFSVLPYLVLRYFLGGVDLVHELAILGLLLVFCGVFTAITVGFSAHHTWMVRGGLVFFLLFGLGALLETLFSPVSMPWFSSAGGIDRSPWVLLAVFVPLALLLMFELGTAKIAPAAEPRSFQLRALGLAFLAGAGVLELAGEGSGIPLILAAPPLLLIGLFSLCENPRWIRSIYAPYVRRGVVGKTAGRFLFYPGWQSATTYTLVVMVLFGSLAMRHVTPDDGLQLALLVALSGLIFPVALTRAIRPRTTYGLAWFLGAHIGMLFLAIMVSVLDQAGVIEAAILVGLLPTCLALLLFWDILPSHDYGLYTTITIAMIGVSLVILFWRALPLIPSVRKMERQTLST